MRLFIPLIFLIGLLVRFRIQNNIKKTLSDDIESGKYVFCRKCKCLKKHYERCEYCNGLNFDESVENNCDSILIDDNEEKNNEVIDPKKKCEIINNYIKKNRIEMTISIISVVAALLIGFVFMIRIINESRSHSNDYSYTSNPANGYATLVTIFFIAFIFIVIACIIIKKTNNDRKKYNAIINRLEDNNIIRCLKCGWYFEKDKFTNHKCGEDD